LRLRICDVSMPFMLSCARFAGFAGAAAIAGLAGCSGKVAGPNAQVRPQGEAVRVEAGASVADDASEDSEDVAAPSADAGADGGQAACSGVVRADILDQPPTFPALVEQMAGSWLLCSTTIAFADFGSVAQDGVEFTSDAHWYALEWNQLGQLVRQSAVAAEGTFATDRGSPYDWELADPDAGPSSAQSLISEVDGSGTQLEPKLVLFSPDGQTMSVNYESGSSVYVRLR
jgi:hypothetical protein